MSKKEKIFTPDLTRLRAALQAKRYKSFFIGAVSVRKDATEAMGKSHMVVTIENDRSPGEPAKYQRVFLFDQEYNFVKEVL